MSCLRTSFFNFRQSRRRAPAQAALIGSLAGLIVGLAGCRTPQSNQRAGAINGAGASFPFPIYSEWFTRYDREHPGVEFNYQAIGSGGGIRQVRDGILDFGGTDSPMTDEQIAASPVKVLHIPTVLGAVVPVYNLPGVHRELNFSAGVIADIYLGTVTRWNDPRIAAENPGIVLPDHEILPVYRSDGSGTTFVLTDFLSRCSTVWQRRIGRATSVGWPIGIGEKGSEGVSGMVLQSPYSFGYVEMNYAVQNGMPYGQVRNAAGQWVKATPESVTAAAKAMLPAIPSDFRASITNPPGTDSYPISSFTWLLVPIRPKDPRHGPVIVDFLRWMLTTGEAIAPGMHYAPLPPELQLRVATSLNGLQPR